VKISRRPAASASGAPLRSVLSRLSASTRARREIVAPLLAAVPLLLAVACASSSPPRVARRSEKFPLDPREELAGPFPEGVESGWIALSGGDPATAEREFLRSRGGHPSLAAEVGLIESRVLLGRTEEALTGCREALSGSPVTTPLLVACGEARARAGQIFEAHELYARAAAQPGSPLHIRERAEELKKQAVESLVHSASSGARNQNYPDARGRIARAIELNPGEANLHALAGDIELAAGQREKAFERYREAYRLDPKNVAVQEKLADLAVEEDPALAVTVLDSLARREPRYRESAAQARLAFRVSNWPAPEREAAQSERLTRAGAASLVWWMFPEIREAKVGSSVIASDAVSRRDSRAILRAVSLGLLDVDRETHRARPDAGLTRRTGARMLLRLLRIVSPGSKPRCLKGSPESGRSGVEAIRAAAGCGLVGDAEGTWIGGREFTRGLDRVRILATGKEEAE
jgi:tetratricopeptide (TPR) repeat protein